MSSNPALLSALKASVSKGGRKPAPLKTRRPTGHPGWPMVLLAGAEKAGKTYTALEASSLPYVDRTFWFGVGENDPDELKDIPGADFEIVEHSGTYQSIVDSLYAAVVEPAEEGKVNLLVFDSSSRLWDMLRDWASGVALERAMKNPRYSLDDEVHIAPDIWNRVADRWATIMMVLRAHQGPVIITARMDSVMVMDDNGKPTKEKRQKIRGHKTLAFDVDVIVEMPARGETFVTGARSLKMVAPLGESVPYRDFSVESLWTTMGITSPEDVGERKHTEMQGREDMAKWQVWFEQAKGDVDKLVKLREAGEKAELPGDFGMFAAINAELAALATKED